MESDSYLRSIPLSESDQLLHSWGFDLTNEYFQIVTSVQNQSHYAVELATGSGRMCAVLSGLFDLVITGDISLDGHTRAQDRVGPVFADRIQYSVLDIEQLPFINNSVPLLFCVNTMHEVRSPIQCLHEMIRTVAQDGWLCVGDFNTKGFETMRRIHEIVYQAVHPEGAISLQTIKEMLSASFSDVRTIETELNTTYAASGKRSSPFF